MVKIVCFSDYHAAKEQIEMPRGDILIFCGDWSGQGSVMDVIIFADVMRSYKFKHKIVCAGNHDWPAFESHALVKEIFKERGITYLCEEDIAIHDLSFYVTPWTPEFCGWAFMEKEEDLVKRYAKIPKNTDVLITHGPPDGILDHCKGSWALRDVVDSIKPKAHLFGHIHSAYGIEERSGTIFVNCSILNDQYEMANIPVVIEL